MSSKTALSDTKTFLNNHNIMLFFSVLFLILAFIWLIGLSGVQTGSCDTCGFGSIVLCSQDSNGDVSSTYEVVAEFFIILLTVLGVGMLTYVLTIKRAAIKLADKGENYAAMIVNGNKNITPEVAKAAKEGQLQNLVLDIGLPGNTIKAGLAAIKNAGKSTGKAAKNAYNYVKTSYNKKDGWKGDDQDNNQEEDQEEEDN